ncbi:flagella synthesis protein FlgN [Chitinimonas sp. BJB300]|uniref:flagella synthesis protein FlgN n=1 Tax=Chitinimonas sp. BJB300 TaxID=1559339 RepID=UPI000C103FAE|nr:flagellar protein FlgN [Chitinimonas sp. BJB300]PHV13009.1 hypothetical protein CSQ89_02760 [Chitinimonas sp. BJB300]TSJ88934.1 flagellar protein FlgN [Chitinimonas sp. BJB300]
MLPSPLLSLLQNEHAELLGFVELLEQEQQALINNALSDLIEYAKQKTARAQSLESLARERKRLFDINGVELSPDPPHALQRVRNLPEDVWPVLANIWSELIQAARHANALNQTNGKLIETRHQQNQQLMTLLQNTQSATLSYDAYGQAKLSRPGGSLGKA